MPSKSKYPQLEADIPNVDLWTFLFERKNREFPDDKVIYIDSDTKRSYTYAQVRYAALEFGKGLKAQWDWKKSDVLAIYSANSNPGYTPEELAFQLKNSGARALVTQKPFLDNAKKAAKLAGIEEDMIILMGDERDGPKGTKHWSGIRNLEGTRRFRKTKVDPKKDLAFLVYSSGTTGHPKGVMLSHRNLVSNVLMLKASEGKYLSWKGGKNGEGDKLLAVLPFFHIYGLTCLIHQSIHSGLSLIVMSTFDLEKYCQLVQTHGITFAYVVPPIVLLLGKSPIVDKYDLSSIRMMNSAAAPLTKDLVEQVYSCLKIPIKQGYGLSETSPTTHLQPWESWQTHCGSVGTLLPYQIAKYMSPEEKEVPIGQTGELWLKGPNVFLGYLNNPEGTKNALTSDGYFKTGDVGHQDADGNFYITDRVKELIKYKGFQVPPAELEGMLIAHPGIDDVAVIGIQDHAQATEVPRAYVVLKGGKKGGDEDGKKIVEWLGKKVASHKKLRGGVRFVDEIPKSI